jgi:hypothetical protein
MCADSCHLGQSPHLLELLSLLADNKINIIYTVHTDHLCGLVVRVPGCSLGGSGFDFLRYQIF